MHDELVGWLRTVDADVVCLQEVTRTPHRSGWATFADGERTLPQRLNLLDDVSAVLTGYTPLFVANDSGPVTDGDGVPLRQDFGVATWVRDEFPVVGLDARFVHSRFVDHTVWDVDNRPRAALTVTVRDRLADRFVSVIHVHVLRDPEGKGDSSIRVGAADTRTSSYTGSIRSASYLLVSATAAVRRFEVVAAPEVSDHRALALVLA